MVLLIRSTEKHFSGAKTKRLFCCIELNFYVENSLATHESYKDAVELEDGNYILSDYHIYIGSK